MAKKRIKSRLVFPRYYDLGGAIPNPLPDMSLAPMNQTLQPINRNQFFTSPSFTPGSIGGAVTAAGSMLGGFAANSSLKDTSAIESGIEAQKNNIVQASNNDQLMSEWGSWNKVKDNWGWKELRGATGGQQAVNTLGSIGSGIASGASIGGPFGAVAGGIAGLGSAIAGIFTGKKKAKKKARSLNALAQEANERALSSFENRASNLDTQSDLALSASYFDFGGPIDYGSDAIGYQFNSQYLNNQALSNMAKVKLTSLPNSFQALPEMNTYNAFADGGPIEDYLYTKVREKILPPFDKSLPTDIEGEDYVYSKKFRFPYIKEVIDRDGDFIDGRRALDAEHSIPYIKDKAIKLSKAGKLSGLKLSTNMLDSLATHAKGVPLDEVIALAHETNYGALPSGRALTPQQQRDFMNSNPGGEFVNKGYVLPSDLLNDHNYYISPYRDELNTIHRRSSSKDSYVYGDRNTWYEIPDDTWSLDSVKSVYNKENEAKMRHSLKRLIKEDKETRNTHPITHAYDRYRKGEYNPSENFKRNMKETIDALNSSPEIQDWIKNRKAEGGGIHIKKKNRGKFTAYCGGKVTDACIQRGLNSSNPTTRKRANFARNARKWKHDFGGWLNTQGGDFTNGVSIIGEGGTHEENPYSGVTFGVDEQGIPNLVEQGEVIFDDYVFSNRITVPKDIKKKYRLKGKTFADAAKSLQKESEERPNDPISKRGLEAGMGRLAEAQEEIRAREAGDRYPSMFAHGGRLFEDGGDMDLSMLDEDVVLTDAYIPGKRSKRASWLRYAPIVGSGMASLSDIFSRPDYSGPESILRSVSNLSNVEFDPIGNYLSYTPLDRNFYINKLNQNAAASRRALLNTSGGNRLQAIAGILASDYNYGQNLGDLARKAEEYNQAQRERVESFNRGTNQFNTEGAMRAQQINKQNEGMRYNAAVQAAQMRRAIDDQRMAGRSANLSSLFQGLGDMGWENEQKNWLDVLADSGVLKLNTSGEYTGRAKGGKVKTKKKKGLTYG